jgi:hypothetical protein
MDALQHIKALNAAWERDMLRLGRLYPADDPTSGRRFMADMAAAAAARRWGFP